MTETLEIIRTGVLATVQDLGRWGYQRFGMPVSGAMDGFALRAANLLVGNARGEAAIEIAMGGLTLRATREAVVAICGGDLRAKLDGRAAPMWKSFAVRPGQELSWDRPAKGTWAYLAVAGGIDVPAVMGSKSTYLRAKVGGLQGRALAKGDVLLVAPGKVTCLRSRLIADGDTGVFIQRNRPRDSWAATGRVPGRGREGPMFERV